MFSTIQRSYSIFKQSLAVLRQDKEILIFPLLSGIFSIIAMIGLISGGVVTGFFQRLAESGDRRWKRMCSAMRRSSSGTS